MTQPPQPQQPPHYNPYAGQPGPPQQQSAPVGPPAMPPQPPMQPGSAGPVPMQQGWPGQPQQPMPGYPVPPGQQQPRTGSPTGAFFLAFLVSFVISLIYSGIQGAALKYESNAVWVTSYLAYCLLSAAAVGALAGKIGGSSAGVRVSATVIAMLGAFFGSTNATVIMMLADGTGLYFLKDDWYFPAQVWWAPGSGYEWVAVAGLVVAAGAAFGLSYAVGRKRG